MVIDKPCEQVRRMKEGTFDLTYRLKEDKLDGRPSFSISVSSFDSSTGSSDSAIACDVTSERDEAMRIFLLVSGGTVTPMTLNDVVSDLIS